MAEYLLPRLEAGGQKFELKINKVPNVGILAVLRDAVIKEDKRRILLIDRTYTQEEYQTIINIASRYELNYVSIFYKDGKHYFRSAAFGEKSGVKGIKYKQTREYSLKDYTNEEVARMMILTQPETIHLKKDNNILYYQPESIRLEEELRRYRYTPIRFSYNHLKSVENEEGKKTYVPENTNSKRIYFNKLVETLTDEIIFYDNNIISKYFLEAKQLRLFS
jgi:hypothetical protein